MEEISAGTTLNFVELLTKSCKSIQASLINDKNCFHENSLQLIEESNQAKITILNNITLLIDEFNQNSKDHTENLLEKIISKSKKFNAVDQDAIDKSITQLKQEIKKCYEYIIENSDIVHRKIKELKEVWDGLLVFQSEVSYVYSRSGQKVE